MSLDGVLVVDKPGGITSHDIVARARRIFSTREVGHAGTLDPMATGVLLLLFGQATKLSNFLTLNDKRYRATVHFGRATDTLDADGSTTEEASVPPESLSEHALSAALAAEKARVRQVPPTFSAIKIGGRRAYALTRAGAAPELAERDVKVEELVLLSHDATTLSLELRVSKGYYVRALARDLGSALGLPAHLAMLRRLASGQFELAEACAWPPSPEARLIGTAEAAQRTLPIACLAESGLRRARFGQMLESTDFVSRPTVEPGTTEAWFSAAGALVALGHERTPGEFRVVRGFGSDDD
ncbi:MAG TPA: tRNA pseudouridine(55) synthase TruB [Polyangiaceae bacterium]|nr:tRNA pseudouridine(55) synthase TruB [Polyangiaceae bacterium]